MNTLLKRIIPYDDEHTILKEHKVNKIQIIPEYLLNYKISCKNRSSPCVFTFISKTKSDFSVYISMQEQVPS